MMPSYNIRHKFVHTVSMPATSAQFKFMIRPLEELGYANAKIFDGQHLSTAKNSYPVFAMELDPYERDVILEGFQWELFLAIAAMTEGEKFIRGEYGVAKGDIGGDRIKEGEMFIMSDANADNAVFPAVLVHGFGWVANSAFRKPTLDEIINYFNPNKTMDQKPSAGRIVIFVLPDTDLERFSNNNATEAPAVITRVFDPESGMINMKVLLDGPDTPWVTSVKYSEEPLPRTWHWPARV